MEPVGRDDIGITDSMYVLVLDNVLFNKCIHVSDKIQYIIKSMYVHSLYDRYSLFIMSLWRYCMNMYCSVSETNVHMPNFLHMFLKMYLTIYMSKNLTFVTLN